MPPWRISQTKCLAVFAASIFDVLSVSCVLLNKIPVITFGLQASFTFAWLFLKKIPKKFKPPKF